MLSESNALSLALASATLVFAAGSARAIDVVPIEIRTAYAGFVTPEKEAAALAGFHTLLRQLPALTPAQPCWYCGSFASSTHGAGTVGEGWVVISPFAIWIPFASHTFHIASDADLAPLGAPVRLADARLILAGSFETARDFVIGHANYAPEYRPSAGMSNFALQDVSPQPAVGGPGYIDTRTYDLKISGVVTAHQTLYKEGKGSLWLTNGGNVWHAAPTVVQGVLKGDSASLATAIVNHATVEFDQAFDGTYAHVISGGQVIKRGAGTLALTQAQAHASDIRIDAGTLALRDAGSVRGALIAATGRLDLQGEGVRPALSSLGGSGEIVLGARGLTLDIAQPGARFDGSIDGAGELAVLNHGIALTGINRFSGGLRVQDTTLTVAQGASLGMGEVSLLRGTLDLGDGTRAGQVLRIIDQGALRGNFLAEWNGRIEGEGTLYKSGAGRLNLSGVNSFSGDLVLREGRLALVDAGSVDTVSKTMLDMFSVLDLTGSDGDRHVGGLSGSGRVELGTHRLIVGRGDAGDVYHGAIVGAGGLVKTGAGIQTLTGFNAYDGDTWIESGVLIAHAQSLSAKVHNAATLQIETTGGLETLQSYSGDIDGTGHLIKSGNGVLWLRGVNTHTGGTRVEAGTLIGNTDSLVGAIDTQAGLAFYQVDAGRFSGSVSGSGTLLAYGPGALTLDGVNLHRGGTAFSNTLRIADDRALGDRASDLLIAGGRLEALAPLLLDRRVVIGSGGGTLDTRGFRIELAGQLEGSDDFAISGLGELVLVRGSRHTGMMQLESGALRLLGDLDGSLRILPGARLSVAGADGTTRIGGDLAVRGELLFEAAGSNGFSSLNLDGMLDLGGATLIFGLAEKGQWPAAHAGRTLVVAAGGIRGFEQASIDWSDAGGMRLVRQGDSLVFAAAPVPEPETWAMLLVGLGLVGFAARRRLHNAA